MALTFTQNFQSTFGNKKVRQYKITFDNSYPTGGEAVAASDFGLKKIDVLDPCGSAVKSDASDALAVGWDQTNSKITLYTSNGAAAAKLLEFTNTGDASAYSVQVLVIGY